MENEFWEARRKHLENILRKAALDLFEHSGGAAAFQIDLDPPHGKLLIVAGSPASILRRLDETNTSAISLLHRAVNGPWVDEDLRRARVLLSEQKQ